MSCSIIKYKREYSLTIENNVTQLSSIDSDQCDVFTIHYRQ